jgi:putative ABC transport system permease protein
MFSDLLFRLRAIFRAKSMDTGLDEELRFHLERQLEKHIRAGLSPEEARRRVRLDFGGATQITEECRDARGTSALEALGQDFRYGFRTLRKNPAFTCVALITLALAIGANTAIFSVVYGVLLHPLPYADPDRLIVLNETHPRIGTISVSYPNFLDWRAQNHVFSGMAVLAGMGHNLSGIAQPETISGQAVSSNFLSLMGVHPLFGRDFEASEDRPGAAPVVMLTYGLWQSHFAGREDVIGRSISLDGRGSTIIAVLPREFRTTEAVSVLEPLGVWLTDNSAATERGNRGDTAAIGRLAGGVSPARARAEMEAIAAGLASAYPQENNQFGIALQPIRELFVGDIRPAILVLFAAVMFVLLIACANVANLFLMRAAGRTREIALRVAIGATGGRIIQQMLAESFVVAGLGGLLGLGLAIAGTRAMSGLIPAAAMSGTGANLNGAVLLFALGATALSAITFGLAPAMQSVRAGVHSRLKESGKSSTGGVRQTRWRTMLVVTEFALAVILLAGAGLMLKSVYGLVAVDPGFRPDHLLRLNLSLTPSHYPNGAAIRAFWRELLDQVRALPGVESAALGTNVPLTNSHSRGDITVEGMPLPAPGSFPHPDRHAVSPGYLRTLGVRLLAGRDFTDSDSETAPKVALINARLARDLFPGQDPVGKRFIPGRPDPARQPAWITIAGVVEDTRMYGLANPSRLEIYRPLAQGTPDDMDLIVKSRIEPASLTSSIRSVLKSIDRNQPISSISTMDQLLRDSVGSRRVTLILLGIFSALALVLAGIGIYGVISYSVAQRTQEIGIRMALGARREDVMRMILLQGARIAATGLAAGMTAAFVLTRYLEKLLFSVSPGDPATFAIVALVLALVALLACYIPARRTLRVDPLTALRYE